MSLPEVVFGIKSAAAPECPVLDAAALLNENYRLHFKTKVLHGIVIGNPFNNLFQRLLIIRILSVIYPAAYKLTENSSEILMSRVRYEASGVGQHTDEVAEAA